MYVFVSIKRLTIPGDVQEAVLTSQARSCIDTYVWA